MPKEEVQAPEEKALEDETVEFVSFIIFKEGKTFSIGFAESVEVTDYLISTFRFTD